jgi:hypothetical protein
MGSGCISTVWHNRAMTPKELATALYGRAAAADPKGVAQRAVRQAARDLYDNAPGGRWHFSEDQIAAIKRQLRR